MTKLSRMEDLDSLEADIPFRLLHRIMSWEIMEISLDSLRGYLSNLYGGEAEIVSIAPLGATGIRPEEALKGYGYGTALSIEFRVGGTPRRVVFNTVRPGGFGHERMADRAAIILWQGEAFNTLPRHVRAIDVGVITRRGLLRSIGDPLEFFILTEMAEGLEYYRDLDRIKASNALSALDLERCRALAEYLAEIHSVKGGEPGLYERRIRELVGHSECIFGLTDSYPKGLEYIGPRELSAIEKRCIDWRWRLKPLTHRLSMVHGDFHPWNIIFTGDTEFKLLDRSRGEWGEPADDVTALAVNYLFYALQQAGRLEGPFRTLWERFFEEYLEATGDLELLQVVQPFFCWRALVVASPTWYPKLPMEVRMKLLNFARNVLEVSSFDFHDVNGLLGG